MKVRVTQRDINAGQPRSICFCPIARAIKRHSHRTGVIVSPMGAVIRGRRYPLPSKAIRFISNFDSNIPDKRLKAKPFTFTMKPEKP